MLRTASQFDPPRRPGPKIVFSYGSNGAEQLRTRVKNPTLTPVKALLMDAERVFGGWSGKWGGAVATLVPRTDKAVQGSVVELTEEELAMLDVFEDTEPGNPYGLSGMYRRQDATVMIGEDLQTPHEVVVYIKNDVDWEGPPSEKYLEAIYKNVGAYWEDAVIEVLDWRGTKMGTPYTGPTSTSNAA